MTVPDKERDGERDWTRCPVTLVPIPANDRVVVLAPAAHTAPFLFGGRSLLEGHERVAQRVEILVRMPEVNRGKRIAERRYTSRKMVSEDT